MLKNYLKIAVRNLLRYKIYSVVNIVGLALGITCTILLTLYVQHELSYDKYYPEAENIYRLNASFRLSGQELSVATVSPALAQIAIDEIPEVEKSVRFRLRGSRIIKYDDISFNEESIVFVDNSVIDFFAIDIVNGDKVNPLAEPNTIILNEKSANKYFGDKNPVGEVLLLNNDRSFKVTGVYKEIPSNTHFNFDFMISMPSLNESKQTSWLSNNFQTYFVIKEGSDINEINKKFNALLIKYMGPEIEKVLGMSLDQLEKKGDFAAYSLCKVTDIHLYSDLQSELGPNGDIKYVYIFAIIAAFILIIACVNFMNISTARSATRAKEVGIRKVLGSYKTSLIKQFLAESFLTTIISMILALGLIEAIIPYFNNLIGKELSLNYADNPFIVFSMLGLLIIIGLLAGSYPAFILSSFRPATVLRGKSISSSKSGSLRSGLVVFQFTASIIMIISTIVVLNQLNYIQNKKLGYNRENVITLDYTWLLGNQSKTFKDKILQHPDVVSASIAGFLPVTSSYNNSMVWPNSDKESGVSIQCWDVDYDYIKTMGMKIVEGRDFSEEFSTDTVAVILNQAAVKVFNLENPVGQRITRPINLQGGVRVYNIIGVVENFNYESLRDNIGPLAMFSGQSGWNISFRVNTAEISSVISLIKNTWDEMAPGQPFSYSFLDERFDNMYGNEQRISKIFGTFAFLAIFIGCLGLFSLSAFTAEQKTKEIGIRKVLGSSMLAIAILLSKEFIKLVGIAFLVAVPVAYYFMDQWLNDFYYRTDLSVWIFVSAGFISIVIAIVTVSYHALKAANANPVESLKYE